MSKTPRVLVIVLAFCLSLLPAFAADAVVIHIKLDDKGAIALEGVPTPLAQLAAAVAKLVRDKDRTAVEIVAPDKTERSIIDQVMDACRRSGVSRFSINSRPPMPAK